MTETVGKQSEICFIDGFPTKRASLKNWLENVIAQVLYLIYILDLVLGRDFGPWVLLEPKLKSDEMKGAPSFPFICAN